MTTSTATAAPRTEAEILDLVRRFEECRLPNDEWGHREHLTVALYYLGRASLDAATDTIREGILRLNASNGIAQTLERGYHETVTVFFARKIHAFVRDRAAESLAERTAAVVERFRDYRGTVREHYSRERIMSWEARTGWVEPDLKALE
jgi:hypothetical protein